MWSLMVFWNWKTQFEGNSYRNCRPSKSQAKQHKEWDCLLGWFNVRHAKTPVIAAKSRMHRFEDICELKEVQANHRWCQYRQLRIEDKEDHFILRYRPCIESVQLEIRNNYIFLLFSQLLSSLRVKIIRKYYCFHLQNISPIHPPESPACYEAMSFLTFAPPLPPNWGSFFYTPHPTWLFSI